MRRKYNYGKRKFKKRRKFKRLPKYNVSRGGIRM